MADNQQIDRSEIDHVLELIKDDLTHQQPADSIITLLAEEPKAILAKNPHVLRQALAAVSNYGNAHAFLRMHERMTVRDKRGFGRLALNTLESAAAELLVHLYALHSYGMVPQMLPAAWEERGAELKAAIWAFVGERDALLASKRSAETERLAIKGRQFEEGPRRERRADALACLAEKTFLALEEALGRKPSDKEVVDALVAFDDPKKPVIQEIDFTDPKGARIFWCQGSREKTTKITTLSNRLTKIRKKSRFSIKRESEGFTPFD